jgi:flagellar motor switch protein FliN/FliY
MADDGGLLSQEEIDMLTQGLLGGGASGGDASVAAAPAPVAQENTAEVTRPFMKVLCEQASSVVTTVTSHAVDFQLQWLVGGENAVIPEELSEKSLFIQAPVKKDLVGKIGLAMSKSEVATLSDLMLMGSGHAEYSDEHKDAIGEIVNQIMGAAVTVLDSQLHFAVEIGQAEISDFHGAGDFKGGAVGTLAVHIEDFPDQKVLLYLDDSLLKAIHTKSKPEPTKAAAPDTSLSSLGLSAPAPVAPTGEATPPPPPPPLAGGGGAGVFGSTGNKALDLLMDIELPIVIELGRAQMSLKRILELGPGAIVEMDRLAGEPVDILINGKVVARGEVVVVDENFGVRILSLVSPEERLKLLR